MALNSKPYTTKLKTKTRGWPPKRRAEQAARLKCSKIWLKSTGPKSIAGKKCVSQNAYVHGLYAQESLKQLKILRQLLKIQGARLKILNHTLSSAAVYPFPTSLPHGLACLHDAPAS